MDDLLDLSQEELAARLDKRAASSTSSAAASASTTSGGVVMGTNSARYIRTTDAEGRPIYVTRTGNYAARTKTVTFSESVPAATTTRQGGIVEYRVITKTETVIRGGGCVPHMTSRKVDHTVLDLGSTTIPFNTSTKIDGTVYTKGIQPQATLLPLAWKADYARGFEHLFNHDAATLRTMIAGAGYDWEDIAQAGFRLRSVDGELTPELNFHRAWIMHMRQARQDDTPYAEVTSLHKHNVRKYFQNNLPTVAVINQTRHAMTASTQTISGTPVVVDPLAMYQQYDPRYHRVAPTPACVGTGKLGSFFHWGKKDCRVQRCMWKNMKPLAITTAFPAQMKNDDCEKLYDYFTQRTTLNELHWGTTEKKGTYYPVGWAKTTSKTTYKTDGTKTHKSYPTCALKRQLPPQYEGSKVNRQQQLGIHTDPVCSDMESCHHYCQRHTAFHIDPNVLLGLLIGIPLLIGVPILALLCCCVPYWLFRRRRRSQKDADAQNAADANNEKERRPSVMDKLRRKSTGQPDAVVNAASGQATDPATGRPVEGGPEAATAIMAGSAAGAAAAGAGGGSNSGNGSGNGSGKGSGAGNGAGAGNGSGAGGPGGDRGSNSGGGGDPSSKASGGGGDPDDGKGTMGRQAEEGRSRVRFDDGAPKPVPEGEPHTEAAPTGGPGPSAGGPSGPSGRGEPSGGGEPPKTDGTLESASGREWDGVGSMRGRRRARG
ncbi:MAG: hypothetical protein INR62_08650, partial [Rhodospirillales bacterium]|nr:hypothetical protein [Acetobacter sp.]